MEWTREAEDALSRVPFFVRKRVRKRVEEEAKRRGADRVTPGHVERCRQRFLQGMDREVRGYRLEACFGSGGCPNRAVESSRLAANLDRLLASRGILEHLRRRIDGPLKFHHEFRIVLSDCPNACSRPQIVDVGIIGARTPKLSQVPCEGCSACVETCREGAIKLSPRLQAPLLDAARCLSCGQCLDVCPSGVLVEASRGFRIQVGGKLGRRPRLAKELPGFFSEGQVVETVDRCLRLWMEQARGDDRFADVLNRIGWDAVCPERAASGRHLT